MNLSFDGFVKALVACSLFFFIAIMSGQPLPVILALIVPVIIFALSSKSNSVPLSYFNAFSIKRLGSHKNDLAKKNNDADSSELKFDNNLFNLGNLSFHASEIQWLGRYKRSNAIRFDLKIHDEWYVVSTFPGDDMLEQLMKRLPDNLRQSRYMYRPEVRSYVGVPAHITTQNLQGIFEKQEKVELHITPLWMVVLHEGKVIQQHFIDDIVDIRATKHPTDLDDAMQLLSFEVGETAYAYALKDRNFVTRLTDAAKQGYDSSLARKKKQSQS